MKDKKYNKLLFSGLPISLPLGLALAFAYSRFVLTVQDLFNPRGPAAKLSGDDYMVMIVIVMIVVALIFLSNVKRKVFDKEDEFNPLKKKDVMKNSTDKKKAQYHKVPSKYLSKEPKDFTVGYYWYGPRKMYVYLPFLSSPEHQLLIGSPGSNKSTTLLNALLYTYNFAPLSNRLRSVLAIDAKPELSKKSVEETRPDVRIINPASMDSCGFDVWHGLSQESSDDEIKERAEMIARALIPTLSGDNAHFSGNAQKILSGCLMYGFRKGYGFTESIVKLMDASASNYIAEIIADSEMQAHPKILHKIKGFEGNDSDEFASIKDTLEKDLDIFDVDTVQYCFSGNPEKATPEDLVKGISIYLAIPDHLLTQYSTVFGMIMEICLKHLMSIPEEDLAGQRPVWCLVDEGGTIYVPSLLDVASRGRSKKIQLSVVVQSYAQLEDLYGDREARSILDCCKTTVVFSCNDTRTARDLSSWTGTYRETKISTNSPSCSMLPVDSSTNVSMEYRPVMDVSDIKNLEKNNEVLVFAKGDWFLVKKAPFYDIPEYSTMSDIVQARNVGRDEPVQTSNNLDKLFTRTYPKELEFLDREHMTEEEWELVNDPNAKGI